MENETAIVEIGAVLTGKVTAITKFGAFVSLPGGKNGMVHISEVSSTYVNDIREHLTEGQEVTVKVIAVENNGNKINLSIKKLLAPPPQAQRQNSRQFGGQNSRKPANTEPLTFEDKLKAFITNSESKMSDLKHHAEKHGGGSGKRRR